MKDPKSGSAEKKASRKLKLNKTTVKQLSEQHLGEVAGGEWQTWVECTADTILCATDTCPVPSDGQRCTQSIPKHVC